MESILARMNGSPKELCHRQMMGHITMVARSDYWAKYAGVILSRVIATHMKVGH